MSKSMLSRRALVRLSSLATLATLSSAALLSGCGGGGSDSNAGSGGVVITPPAEITVTHRVTLTTNQGVIELGLDANKAPITVANFLKYVNDGYYTNTIFHRVIKDFVIQGGGLVRTSGALTEKTPTYAPITLESNKGLRNVRGTIAMARTAAANSATSQFFINTVDNSFLDFPGQDGVGGYAVFGKVTVGLDVVDKIRAVSTRTEGFYNDVPVTDVVVTSAKEVK